MSIGPWNKCGYIFFLSLKVTFSLNKFLCSYVTFSLTIDTLFLNIILFLTIDTPAGMKCIGLKNPNSGKQDLSQADLVVENFNQLNLDIIKDLFK